MLVLLMVLLMCWGCIVVCINSVAVVVVNAGAISKCQVGCVHIDLKYNEGLYISNG